MSSVRFSSFAFLLGWNKILIGPVQFFSTYLRKPRFENLNLITHQKKWFCCCRYLKRMALSKKIEYLEKNDEVVDLRKLPLYSVSLVDIASIVERALLDTKVKEVDFWLPAYPPPTAGHASHHFPNKSYDFLNKLSSSNVMRLLVCSIESETAWSALCDGLLIQREGSKVSELILGEASIDGARDCENTISPSACSKLSHVLRKNSSLKLLSLRGFFISPIGLDFLCQSMAGGTNLHEIELQQIRSSISLNLSHFFQNSLLQSLNLIDCHLSFIESFFSSAKKSSEVVSVAEFSSLVSLRLIDCSWTCPNAFDDLCTFIAKSKTLRLLDLRGEQEVQKRTQSLAKMLAENKTLEKLILAQTNLDDDCIDILNELGLSQNETLRTLDLSDNPSLTKLPTRGMLDSLISSHNLHLNLSCLQPLCSTIKCLDLQGCRLVVSSLDILCRHFIVSSSVIESLHLVDNDFSDFNSCQSLREFLASPSCRLKNMDVSSCQIDDKFLFVLAESLQINSSLENLNLQFNHKITNRGILVLEETLSSYNFTLTTLKISSYRGRQSLSLSMLHHWIQLNQAGRRHLRALDSVSYYSWLQLLSHADDIYGLDALYYLVRNVPRNCKMW